MVLNQRGTREIPERWGPAPYQSVAGVQGDSPSPYGRSMMCQGLRRLPKPIPHDVTKMTVYGDSSGQVPVVTSPMPGIQNDRREVFISDTQIRYITRASFYGNYRMKELTLSGNNIGILYPNIFQPLRALKKLSLTNNNVRHLSAAVFNGLASLEELKMSDNMIRFLPQSIFNYLPNLKVLRINGNKLRRLPRSLFTSLKELAVLDLSRNNLTDLYDDVFDSNIMLEELLLNGNRLWTIRSRWFQNLHSLRVLSLRGNVITRINSDSFSSLFNLQELLLSANHITEVGESAFRNLRDLKILDLATNDIQNIPRESLSDLDSLQDLFLASNKIATVSNGTFQSVRTLRRLDLSRNSISIMPSVQYLAALQYLDLSHNKITNIPRRSVYGLTELKEITFDHNFIKTIGEDAFMTTASNEQSKLTVISLENNIIKEISAAAFRGVRQIKTLNLANNKLKRIHSLGLSGFQNLRTLDLGNNRIRDLNNGVFGNLRRIVELNLSNNKLRRITDTMMTGMTALEEINLSSNSISYISPKSFRRMGSLVELNLKQNRLMGFNFTYITNLPNLAVVDLSDNHLFWVDLSGSIQLRLKELILTGNNINTVTREVTNIMNPSSILDMTGNPLLCDCQMKWISDSVLTRKIRLDADGDVICKLPNRLHGRKATDLTPDEMTCDADQLQGDRPSMICDDSHFRMRSLYNNRQGERKVLKRHVTLIDRLRNEVIGNGVLLDENWILASGNVLPDGEQLSLSSSLKVKIGRKKGNKKIVQAFRHPLTTWRQYNVALLRLESQNTSSRIYKEKPCLMTEKQFKMIARIYTKITLSTRVGTRRNKLKPRRGRVQKTCAYASYLCININGRKKSASEYMLLRGSPLYLGYSGDLNLAGIGLGDWSYITQNSEPLFIPVWNVSDWISDVTYEYDSKCATVKGQNRSSQCVRDLKLPTAADLLAKIQRPERH